MQATMAGSTRTNSAPTRCADSAETGEGEGEGEGEDEEASCSRCSETGTPSAAEFGPRGGDLRGDLRASMGDAAAWSVMTGMGELYLPAFALAVGIGEVAAGLIACVPMFFGAMLQLFSPLAIRWIGSHRRWVVLCVTLQGAMFLPLLVGALVGSMSLFWAYLFVALYWCFGMASGPVWNAWMSELVPIRLRAGFFARRTRVSQGCMLAGFFIAGFSLQAGATHGCALQVFALIFLVSALARFLSAYFLSCQSEVPVAASVVAPGSTWTAVRRFFRRENKLLHYFALVQWAAQISGPFFTPYMLNHLHFSYGTYATLIAVSYLAKVCALPMLGRYAQTLGTTRLLWIGGLGIIPISGAWYFSDHLVYLLLVQVAAGVLWAAYELAVCLLLFESIRPDERTGLLTVYNFFVAAATALGAISGGLLLWWLARSPEAYLLVFVLSSFARASALLVLISPREPTPRETLFVPKF